MNDSTLFGLLNVIDTDNTSTIIGTSNALEASIYNSYVSTTNYVTSSLYGISSFSTFYTDTSFILSTTQAGLSTLSTAINVENAITYSTLTGNYTSSLTAAITSTTDYTNSVYSSLSSYTAYKDDLSTFSSIITEQLLSTSDGLYTYISSNDAFIYDSLSSLNATVMSTISTVNTYNNIIDDISAYSTNISSILYGLISSFVSTPFYEYQSTVNSTIGILSTNLDILYSSVADYSTGTYTYVSSVNSTIYQNAADISTLQRELSILTTSSILVGIYDSFIDLQGYSQYVLGLTSSVTYVVVNNDLLSTTWNLYNEVVSTVSLSSLYTSQDITITNSQFVGIMDLRGYRNFNVNIYDVVDGSSNYRLTYLSNSLSGLDYNQGNIFINISTVGQTYTNNNGQLIFDVYHWGFPNNQNENFFPSLGDGDYTLQYTYTIKQSVVYTSLLNAYPRLATYAMSFSSINSPSVIITTDIALPGYIATDHFWRGEQLQVSWSNYSFFPFGSSNYNPTMAVDLVIDDTLYNTYGPFELNVSTTTITLPYISTSVYTNQYGSVITSPKKITSLRSYIIGNRANNSAVDIYTVSPAFNIWTMSTNGTSYTIGNELVGIADNGFFPLNNRFPTVYSISGNTSYSNLPEYGASNLVNGILNQMGKFGYSNIIDGTAGAAIVNGFTDFSIVAGYPSFYVNIGYNALTNLSTLQGYGSQINATFSDVSNTFSFVCQEVATPDPVYGYSILSNDTLPVNPYTFTSPQTIFKFTYTPVLSTYTTGYYTESNFVGPENGFGSSDPSAYVVCDIAKQSNIDNQMFYTSISTITFYNITDTMAPKYGCNIDNNRITMYTSDQAGNFYGSTLFLTSDKNAQVFSF